MENKTLNQPGELAQTENVTVAVPVPVEPVAQMPQTLEHAPVVTEIPPKPKKSLPKKPIIIGMVVLVLLIIFFVIIVFVASRMGGVGSILPIASPTPTATPVVEVKPASPYANDPDVVKLKEDLANFNKKLDETELREDTLRVPTLEWNVDFKK